MRHGAICKTALPQYSLPTPQVSGSKRTAFQPKIGQRLLLPAHDTDVEAAAMARYRLTKAVAIEQNLSTCAMPAEIVIHSEFDGRRRCLLYQHTSH